MTMKPRPGDPLAYDPTDDELAVSAIALGIPFADIELCRSHPELVDLVREKLAERSRRSETLQRQLEAVNP